MKFDGLLWSKKQIPSAKTLYTEDLTKITFKYLCGNSPNSLCQFWNHKSFFTIQHLCIFLAQTLHTFYCSSPSKCKFSDFPLLSLKFTKFLMSFLEPRISFSSNFASLFSVMRHNSSVLFHKSLYALHKGSPLKCKFSDFRLLVWKLTKFLMSFFKPRSVFSLKFASLFSVMTHNYSDVF